LSAAHDIDFALFRILLGAGQPLYVHEKCITPFIPISKRIPLHAEHIYAVWTSVSLQLPVSQPRVDITLPDGSLPQVRHRRRGAYGLDRRQRREPEDLARSIALGGQRSEEVEHLRRRVLLQARGVEALAARLQLREPVAVRHEREREARGHRRDDVRPRHRLRVRERQERVLRVPHLDQRCSGILRRDPRGELHVDLMSGTARI
jgi:hypothetical protein